MVSKTYTARELSSIRQSSVEKELYGKLYEKLHKDADLGEIFRMPPERALSLIEEEESTEPKMESRTVPGESTVRQLDGTDTEWKYRGRNEMENGEHQPIGAPAGVSAQRDEGFQRFYKAVVSPTHVRVTAGGRIVPNTRGSSSPSAKWAKEKPIGDGPFVQRPTPNGYGEVSDGQIPSPMPQAATYGPYPHVISGWVQSPHATVAPGPHPPIAVMPWQIGMGVANSYGMMQPHAVPMLRRESIPTPSAASVTSEKADESANFETSTSFRISPPVQFDNNRPLLANGQFVVPAGTSFYPYGVTPLPLQGGPAPTFMQPRVHMPAVVYPSQAKVNQTMQVQMPSASSTPSISGHSAVPISSIRPSDITRKQIDVLKNALRYFEDQLQYNKHQIDEKHMDSQAKMVRQQMQQFEVNLKAQLQHEQTYYPAHDNHQDADSSTGRENGKGSTSSTANEVKSERESSQSSLSQGSLSQPQPNEKQKTSDTLVPRHYSVLRQVKSVSAPVSTKITPESSEESEPNKKSSALPVSAALAAPFHPRNDSTTSVPVPKNGYVTTTSSIEDKRYASTKSTGCTNSSSSESFTEKPYLIGKPVGDGQSSAEQSNGYVYGRDLTEDELRARHMYWGKAPRHLQKGLPKFDGKDFYPPSPTKSSVAVYAENGAKVPSLLTGSKAGPDCRSRASKPSMDPFRSLGRSSQRPFRGPLGIATQTNNLGEAAQTTKSPNGSLRGSCSSLRESGRNFGNFCKALDQHAIVSSDGGKDKSSDEGDDNSNLLFRGRKYMANGKTRPETWQRMWKHNKTSPTAVPGTISSMTARGVLPNYAGHATASLTPAIANASISPQASASKPYKKNHVASPNGRHDTTAHRPSAAPIKRDATKT